MSIRIKPIGAVLKGYMAANNVSQRKLCEITGYQEKQISLILNDKTSITPKFAKAFSNAIPGVSEDFILDYYSAYKKQCESDKEFLEKNNYKENAKKYSFSKVFKRIDSDPVIQVDRVNEAFGIDNLNDLDIRMANDQLFNEVSFSKDVSKLNDTDNKVVTIWTKVAMKQMMVGEEKREFVGVNEAKRIIKENKELLNVTDSSDLIANIEYICNECGIHIGFSKSVPTTYIRGLSFSIDGQLFIILTDRFKRVEYVVFAFVHEMEHIFNGDITIEKECIRYEDDRVNLEEKADECARDFLIGPECYSLIKDINNPRLSEIYNVANKARCSIGTVIARIHHDTKNYQQYWQYLNSFEIEMDMFGN